MPWRHLFLPFIRRGALALVILQALPAAGLCATVDDTARVLGGLQPAQASDTGAITSHDAWKHQADLFSKAWQRLEETQLSPAREWAGRELAAARKDAASVLYYAFSGPDILYANTFFPDAKTYVLCGLEPVGSVPDLASIPPNKAAEAIRSLHASLNTVLALSFFKTKDMQSDLRNTLLPGTTPILLTFLARLGKTVRSATPITIDADGNELAGNQAEPPAGVPGVRIEFDSGPGTPVQTVYYFSANISNEGIKKNAAFANFCRKLPEGAGLVKAASYLMHGDAFSDVRDLLLERCHSILQDDTGIPASVLSGRQWDIHPHGRYVGPIKMFSGHYQKDLAKIFSESPQTPLGFGISYHYRKDDSGLVLATRGKNGGAIPRAVAANPEPPTPPVEIRVATAVAASPGQTLRALEDEELRIRADASLTRKEKLRLLREIWKQQLAVIDEAL